MAKKDKGRMTGNPVTYHIPSPAGGVQLETFIPWTLVKRGVKKQVLTPLDAPEAFQEEAVQARQDRKAVQDSPLIRALGLAHYWQRLLDDGTFRSITEIAAVESLDLGQASRIARLTQLAPDIVEACIKGEENGLALENLNRRAFSMDWGVQRLALFSSHG